MNPLKEKLLSRIKISKRGCWEWTGYIKPNGYAAIVIKTKKFYIHRFSYILFYGKIPKGRLVCHKCDNRKCANPSHLFLGSNKDNTEDCIKKGRWKWGVKKGEKSKRRSLSDKKVKKIKTFIKNNKSKLTYEQISKVFHVKHSLISDIGGGRYYKDIII